MADKPEVAFSEADLRKLLESFKKAVEPLEGFVFAANQLAGVMRQTIIAIETSLKRK